MAKEEKNEEVSLIQVATQTENLIQLPNGDKVDIMAYLVWLGNEILEIKKVVA